MEGDGEKDCGLETGVGNFEGDVAELLDLNESASQLDQFSSSPLSTDIRGHCSAVACWCRSDCFCEYVAPFLPLPPFGGAHFIGFFDTPALLSAVTLLLPLSPVPTLPCESLSEEVKLVLGNVPLFWTALGGLPLSARSNMLLKFVEGTELRVKSLEKFSKFTSITEILS